MGGWLVGLCLVRGLGYFLSCWLGVGGGWVIGGLSQNYARCSMQ